MDKKPYCGRCGSTGYVEDAAISGQMYSCPADDCPVLAVEAAAEAINKATVTDPVTTFDVWGSTIARHPADGWCAWVTEYPEEGHFISGDLQVCVNEALALNGKASEEAAPEPVAPLGLQRLTPEREAWLRKKPAHYHVHEVLPELDQLRAQLAEQEQYTGKVADKCAANKQDVNALAAQLAELRAGVEGLAGYVELPRTVQDTVRVWLANVAERLRALLAPEAVTPVQERPAVGSVHNWAVAKADMETRPEARYRDIIPNGKLWQDQYRCLDGRFQRSQTGRNGTWEEGVRSSSEHARFEWIRLPDADAPAPAQASKVLGSARQWNVDLSVAVRLSNIDDEDYPDIGPHHVTIRIPVYASSKEQAAQALVRKIESGVLAGAEVLP